MINIDFKKELREFTLNFKTKIKRGEFLAIKGSNGSGKSTTLRVIAGLEDAQGDIEVFNSTYLKNKSSLPVQKRDIGFVFQNYALFENMSAIDNLLYANSDTNLANYLLERTNLYEQKHIKPKNLSGGQKQRIALCRALIKKPQLLLMDEPFSSLDIENKISLYNYVQELTKEFNTTTIMVTHSQSDIDMLANRVLALEKGAIVDENIVDFRKTYGKVIKIEKNIAHVLIGDSILYINITDKKITKGESVRVGLL